MIKKRQGVKMNYEKDKYWLWMSHINEMWSGKARKIIEYIDSPQQLYEMKQECIEKLGIFTKKDIYNIMSAKNINLEEVWEKMCEKEIRFTHSTAEDYPKRLLGYRDRPLWLFYRGGLPKDDEKLVGVVGARNCSHYGISMAEHIGMQLGKYSVGVVSGMARGIDAASHKGALNVGANSYAVLGCGVDVCYPRENIELYMELVKNGGVISEYIPGTRPLAWQFPERNRIISMFSDAIAVIEAKENSGSLITTDYALQYGKEIFAVPGRVGDALSRGCNELIRSGASILLEGDDILYSIGMFDMLESNEEKTIEENNCKIVLEKENEVVYSCLGLLPKNVEDIIKITGKSSSEIINALTQLIIMGLVIEPVRNYYAIKK